MNDLLEKVVESFRANWKNKGLKFRLELSKAAPEITGDAAHIEEILVNVFRNAERFVESLGRQVLEVYSDVLECDVLISITPGGGPSSMASEALPDPERTEGPSGLGLSVCRSLIEGAGGSLRVDRGTHRGFCIEIEYPLARENWSATPAPAVQDRGTRRTGAPAMVLLIDDDVATQDKLLHYLTDRGHRTVLASSVEEGIDLAERGRFHWVMCKIQMGRMSGLELYNRLRKQAEKFVFLADEKVIVYNEELFSGKDRFILHKPLRTADVERVLDGLEGRACTRG
jgi:CheY-like chemotaxis protein